MLLGAWDKIARPVMGMIHLAPLAGSPRFGGSMDVVREAMLRDAKALAEGGVHGLMMENFGDAPFYPGRVPHHVVAQIAALAWEVKRNFPELPLGINVLRNDGLSAVAVAHAAGAQLIRVNVLCGARVTDQGIIQGIAHDLLRLRRELAADHIKIFADVDVKHSAALTTRPLAEEVEETIERGLADAVIVSGAGTGKPADVKQLREIKKIAGKTAVFLGSGVQPDTVKELIPHADGFIVGTWFKQGGRVDAPVDPKRVRELIEKVQR